MKTIKESWAKNLSEINDVREQVARRAQHLHTEIEEQKDRSLRKLDTLICEQNAAFQNAMEKLEALHSTLTAYKQYMNILHSRGKDLDKTAHVPGLREKVGEQTKHQLEKTHVAR